MLTNANLVKEMSACGVTPHSWISLNRSDRHRKQLDFDKDLLRDAYYCVQWVKKSVFDTNWDMKNEEDEKNLKDLYEHCTWYFDQIKNPNFTAQYIALDNIDRDVIPKIDIRKDLTEVISHICKILF